MKLIFLLALLSLCGCVMKNPEPAPMGFAWTEHDRLLGIDMSVPATANSTSFIHFKLGLVTHSQQLVPVAPVPLFAPPLSDEFIITNTGLFSIPTVQESLVTGSYPLASRLFQPKLTLKP